MKNIQNLAGFVMTSRPENKTVNAIAEGAKQTQTKSAILKFDYCIPPKEPAAAGDMFIVNPASKNILKARKINAA
ncbi:MAG: hypothetical protein QM791_11365 [Ferruginibacter sp.]